ncbi:hypothetical protein U9M48_021555 [Paspalum notatum var. saurae]|uniref:Rho termination factor-like N-terminal domain-containing protein n=1 Tax=Paspalum notatum var. saurae TaxID=547442 RepID=A0AAQ3TH05_PASNO
MAPPSMWATQLRYALSKMHYSADVALRRCYAGQVGIEELAGCLHRSLFQEKLTSVHWVHNVKSEMSPTIHSKDGAAILVRKLPHYPNPPGVFVGDTVVFRDPCRRSQYLFRRVAAIEGCEMLSTDEKDEPFVLAHNHCWVLVDNPSLTPKTVRDSRSFGPVPLTAIYGRAIYSLMTSADHGPIQNSCRAMEQDSPVLALELDLDALQERLFLEEKAIVEATDEDQYQDKTEDQVESNQLLRLPAHSPRPICQRSPSRVRSQPGQKGKNPRQNPLSILSVVTTERPSHRPGRRFAAVDVGTRGAPSGRHPARRNVCRGPRPPPPPRGLRQSNLTCASWGLQSPSRSSIMGTSPILVPMRVPMVCSESPNNHRPMNSDILRQQKGGSSRGKGKPYQDKDDSENIDEFDSDIMFSKNGPPISLTSNSRPQATSAPGEREKEIVELFKRVQAQLRARGKSREDKKPEPAKVQGERGSETLSGPKKSSDDKEQNFDLTRRSSDCGNRQGSTMVGTKSDTQEEQKQPPPAAFKMPASNFRRRSTVLGVKFQPVTSADTDANRKSIANNIADAVQNAKTSLDERTATDEPADTVSPYEPDSVIEPENISLDDLAGVVDDDESDADEPDEECLELEPSLEIADATDTDGLHDNGATASSDLSSLKVAELRELAKSRGLKGYSKMKENELIEVLSSSVA